MLPNIQEYLVPRRPATRYAAVEVAHLWQPLDEIGGDFLYYERVTEDIVSVEIGDVMGHGTQAGLVMTALHGLLFGLRQQLVPVDKMLTSANDFLCRLHSLGTARDPNAAANPLLCSMFLLRIDLKHRALTYCNAGHPAALYVAHGSDSSIMALKSGGPILGAFPTASYASTTMRPAKGDTVLLFTDGLTEAANTAGEELGRERLEQLAQTLHELAPREILSALSEHVRTYRGEAVATDDLAVAAVQFNRNWQL